MTRIFGGAGTGLVDVTGILAPSGAVAIADADAAKSTPRNIDGKTKRSKSYSPTRRGWKDIVHGMARGILSPPARLGMRTGEQYRGGKTGGRCRNDGSRDCLGCARANRSVDITLDDRAENSRKLPQSSQGTHSGTACLLPRRRPISAQPFDSGCGRTGRCLSPPSLRRGHSRSCACYPPCDRDTAGRLRSACRLCSDGYRTDRSCCGPSTLRQRQGRRCRSRLCGQGECPCQWRSRIGFPQFCAAIRGIAELLTSSKNRLSDTAAGGCDNRWDGDHSAMMEKGDLGIAPVSGWRNGDGGGATNLVLELARTRLIPLAKV